MGFISVKNAVCDIECEYTNGNVCGTSEFWKQQKQYLEELQAVSKKAILLNEKLNECKAKGLPFPAWKQFDKDSNSYLYSPNAEKEGQLAMLDLINTHKIYYQKCREHLEDCKINNWNPTNTPVGGQIKWGSEFDGKLKGRVIGWVLLDEFFNDYPLVGFDREEIVEFLDRNCIRHNLHKTNQKPINIDAESNNAASQQIPAKSMISIKTDREAAEVLGVASCTIARYRKLSRNPIPCRQDKEGHHFFKEEIEEWFSQYRKSVNQKLKNNFKK